MEFDITIVGAGPAGMEAALQASQYTNRILIVDSRPEPGGNVYASINSNAQNFPHLFENFGPAYRKGHNLVKRFLNAGFDYRPCTSVWNLTSDGQMACRGPEGAYIVRAKKIILSTGAYERPLPIPGWTIPGVMNVGAAQLALKSSGIMPETPTVIIGDGPLALLFAKQVQRAGGAISAFIIPQSASTARTLSSGSQAALLNPAQTAYGLSMLLDRTRSKTEVFRVASQIRILGQNTIEGVHFENAGKVTELPAASVLLHDGIVPDVNISAGSGLEITWSDALECWHPLLDDMGKSSQPNIYVAGDAGKIGGAAAAHLSGKRAAIAACASLTYASESDVKAICSKTDKPMQREIQYRTVLSKLYPTAFSGATQSDNLTLCRCEGIKIGDIRREIKKAKSNNTDPNRLKSALRCGMGPCQGRNCNLSIAKVIAHEMDCVIDHQLLPRTRAPFTQVTLGELANLSEDQTSDQPVDLSPEAET